MPAILVFRAQLASGARVTHPLGPALHAVFLEMLQKLDGATAQALHDHGPNKPYALSPLLDDGNGLVWRWHALTEPVREAMLALAQQLPGTIMPTGQAVALQWEPTHRWATTSPLERLLQEGTPAGNRLYQLKFLSPTTFRSNGQDVPLPLPRLMLQSYWSRWNAFAAEPLAGDLVARAEPFLRVVSYQLATRHEHAGKVPVTGFTGKMAIALAAAAPPELARQVHALFALAPYCGTGAKTAMGFGQTQVELPPVSTMQASLRREQANLVNVPAGSL